MKKSGVSIYRMKAVEKRRIHRSGRDVVDRDAPRADFLRRGPREMLDRNNAAISPSCCPGPGVCIAGNNQCISPSFLQSLSPIDSQNQHRAE